MLSRIYPLILLTALSSCALFKSQKIQNEEFQTLINYVKGEGEGRGRLGINQHQYLIGFEAFLKENHDWILAATIPLHGEEVLLLKDLKLPESASAKEGLELRIENGIIEYLKEQKKSPELAKAFLLEFRRLMRLVFHKRLGLTLNCNSSECLIDEETYQVSSTDNMLTLNKSLSDEYEIEFVATNLTDSIFKRSNIFLHSKNRTSKTQPLLSLELFWD